MGVSQAFINWIVRERHFLKSILVDFKEYISGQKCSLLVAILIGVVLYDFLRKVGSELKDIALVPIVLEIY